MKSSRRYTYSIFTPYTYSIFAPYLLHICLILCYSGSGRSSRRLHGLYGGGPQVPNRRREIPRTPSSRAGLTTAPCTTPRAGPATAEFSGDAGSVIARCALCQS